MTNEANIRAALEERLAAIAGALPTAWENVDFAPISGTAYQRVHLMRGQPENPEVGTSNLKRHVGVFQVTLFYPQSSGPKDAEAQAGAIVSHFPRGLSLTKNGIIVTIDTTPYVMDGFEDGDRYAVPIRVPYFSNIP